MLRFGNDLSETLKTYVVILVSLDVKLCNLVLVMPTLIVSRTSSLSIWNNISTLRETLNTKSKKSVFLMMYLLSNFFDVIYLNYVSYIQWNTVFFLKEVPLMRFERSSTVSSAFSVSSPIAGINVYYKKYRYNNWNISFSYLRNRHCSILFLTAGKQRYPRKSAGYSK